MAPDMSAGTEASQPTRQLSSLLSNEELARVERMRLNPLRRLTNRSKGEHLSGKGGRSTDLADYRNYVDGDDVRFIDWNIFARLNRPFLKQFQHEEEMHVVILLDASASMAFEGKFDLARQLAASFGIMGLMNVECISIYSATEQHKALQELPPCRGRVARGRMLSYLQSLETGGAMAIEQAVEKVLRKHSGRGVAIVLSDYLSLGDFQRSANLLFSAGLEPWIIQILSPAELNPELNDDLRLIDAETGQMVDVTVGGDLLDVYYDHLDGLTESLRQMARQRAGRYLQIDSSTTLSSLLTGPLRKGGWVR